MSKMKKQVFPLIILSICSLSLTAQSTRFNITDETTMTISGTSTLHEWTSDVNKVTGWVATGNKFAKRGKVKTGAKIAALELEVPVKSIISPRGTTMDNKTYKALKSDQHPQIKFVLSEGVVTALGDDGFEVQASGDLTIAGKTNQVTFPVTGKILDDEKMSFTGAYKLNMKDYDMVPPSAMFGQIVTGEEVEIKFTLIVKK